MHVSLSRGRYMLSTANAVYSYEDLYDNYTKAFERMNLEKLDWQEVLVLGLGLGSVPWMLERKFGQYYQYTLVEIDPEVIDLARRYALEELSSPMTTYCADGLQFVQTHAQQYDCIVMDVFLDDTVPAAFEEVAFLKSLQALLAPEGLLMYNRLANTPTDRKLSRHFFEHSFRKVFPASVCWELGGNWMLLNRSV